MQTTNTNWKELLNHAVLVKTTDAFTLYRDQLTLSEFEVVNVTDKAVEWKNRDGRRHWTTFDHYELFEDLGEVEWVKTYIGDAVFSSIRTLKKKT